MIDEKRLAAALRAKGFFVHRNNSGHLAYSSDEQILEATKGTCFRAAVELDLACADLRDEIVEQFGRPVARVLFALGRFIRWLKGEKNGTGSSD